MARFEIVIDNKDPQGDYATRDEAEAAAANMRRGSEKILVRTIGGEPEAGEQPLPVAPPVTSPSTPSAKTGKVDVSQAVVPSSVIPEKR